MKMVKFYKVEFRERGNKEGEVDFIVIDAYDTKEARAKAKEKLKVRGSYSIIRVLVRG